MIRLRRSLNTMSAKWFTRPDARAWRCPPAPTDVRAFHQNFPGYAPTPLTELPALATELGVGRVLVKDESARFGLPAFKALGASWAVHRVLEGRAEPVTLVTATDGNHGRAVARMARIFGHRAHIFVPRDVPQPAMQAIIDEQAEVTVIDGSYDDAVRRATETEDAILVQDMGWPGYEEIPGWIVEGYATLCAEIDDVVEPDLVVVPVGVGSLAQAVITHYRSGAHGTPALLAVEPETAACVQESLRADRPVTITTSHTIMAGLNCGTPSGTAWPFLRNGLDAAITVSDDECARAATDLHALGVHSGPCGAAPLAGLRAAPREELGLDSTSVIVLLSTEGSSARPRG